MRLILQFEDNAAVCVVLGIRWLSGAVRKGQSNHRILRTLKEKTDITSSTPAQNIDADGNIVTNGGRVLGVTAKGKDLKEARQNAYAATEWISFENKYMRHDIGKAIDEA